MVAATQVGQFDLRQVTAGQVVTLEATDGGHMSFRIVGPHCLSEVVQSEPSLFDNAGTVELIGYKEDSPLDPDHSNRTARRRKRFLLNFLGKGLRITKPIAQVYVDGQPQFT
jgi:hypothetical protein